MKGAKYFYANEDVDLYDITIYLTQPFYKFIHEQVIRVIKNYHQNTKGHGLNILDIGSGTGNEIIGILSVIEDINIVALDISNGMIHKSKERILQEYPRTDYLKKVKWLNEDIRSEKITSTFLLNSLNSDNIEVEKYDIVLSAFTLHHLSYEEKSKLYKTIHHILKPRGLFVNADLFSYSDKVTNTLSNKLSKEFMVHQLTKPDEEFTNLFNQLAPEESKEQLGRWINHWDYENKPIPIINYPTHNKNSESFLLQESGFQQTEIIFRYLHSAILMGIMSESC